MFANLSRLKDKMASTGHRHRGETLQREVSSSKGEREIHIYRCIGQSRERDIETEIEREGERVIETWRGRERYI